jgi:hypothetical protein
VNFEETVFAPRPSPLHVIMTGAIFALALTTASWLPTSLVPTPFTCRAAHHQRTAVQCVAAERVDGKSTPFDDEYISIPGDEEVEAADVLASLALDDDGGIAGDSEKPGCSILTSGCR